MRKDDNADALIEVSVTRGNGARLELPAETADRLNLTDGDTVTALIGRTASEIEHRLAVERWVEEGADREMTVDEFMAYLDRCPEPAE